MSSYFLQVVEEPYTVREARIHVRHVRDLMKSVDPTDAYNGSDCASLAFLNTVCQVGDNDFLVRFYRDKNTICIRAT